MPETPPAQTTLNGIEQPIGDWHTTKRGANERNGIHKWHTYYAGYAEQFVADALRLFGHPKALVLDPWNGSGTTTLVAQRQGFRSVGVEINPVMMIHACAKNLRFVQQRDEILAQGREIVRIAQKALRSNISPDSPILDFVEAEPLSMLLAIRDAILQDITPESAPEFLMALSSPGAAALQPTPKRKAFFLSALFQVLRQVGKLGSAFNPTWLFINKESDSVSVEAVTALFIEIVETMLQDLEAAKKEIQEPADYAVILADSKQLPFREASFDLIITSPPYLTRIDYVYSTKPELLLLGHSERSFDLLRRANMGAPLIVDKKITPNPSWGTTCNVFLQSVTSHTSKAAVSYYLPCYLQYFRDAEWSLRSIFNILKSGGQALIVVQSSYYKEVELSLGQIYREMAEHLGMSTEVAKRQNVKQHMAHSNKKSQKYVTNKVYHEDTIHLVKNKS